MGLITENIIDNLNYYLSCVNSSLSVGKLTIGDTTEGFKLFGLVDLPIIVKLPNWKVQEYRKGFGGWVIFNQETNGAIRFVRHKLTHPNLSAILGWVEEERDRNRNFDPRSNGTMLYVVSMLPKKEFYFQSFEEQLCVELYRIITNLSAVSSGKETTRRIGAAVRREVTAFLNTFPVIMSNSMDEDKARVLFSRDQIVIGTPKVGDAIGGIPELLRDLFVKFLHDSEEIYNFWGEGPFRPAIGCTSKGKPGEWVSVIPKKLKRKTPLGWIEEEKVHMPAMISATSVFVENPKRVLREGNAVQNAWDLKNPRCIDQRIWTGYEHLLDESMHRKVTEVFTCFASIEGINVYPGENGELLNLDDIILTPSGREALRTTYSSKRTFTDEQWKDPKIRSRYYGVDGKTPKPGYQIWTEMTRITSIDNVEVYQPTVTVLEPERTCLDTICKVMLGSTLKAMAKLLDHELYAVDSYGKQYPIEVVVSGMSIKEKKVPTLPLAAVAARVGLGFIENVKNPISPNRKPEDPYNAYDDLINKIGTALKDNNQDPSGLMRIYARDPERRTDTYLGTALCGWVRACVLMENEHTSSRTKQEAVPFQISVRNLANMPVVIPDDVKRQINSCANLRRQLTACVNHANENKENVFYGRGEDEDY